MIRKVRNCCETCENLVCVATIIGQLQHSKYLKLTFLDTVKWAIRPVFPETVTYSSVTAMIESLNWVTLRERCKIARLSFFHDIVHSSKYTTTFSEDN